MVVLSVDLALGNKFSKLSIFALPSIPGGSAINVAEKTKITNIKYITRVITLINKMKTEAGTVE
jgi:hypothetical protein